MDEMIFENDGLFGDMTETPRKNLPIFYLLDTSGSMIGEPIAILNRAMTETMEELKKVAKKNSNAKLQIAVMEFNTNVKWMQPDGLEEAEDFYWVDLQAGGLTEVGAALKELDSKLSRETFLKGIMGNLMPVIIIMTDGGATSDYKKELDEIKKNRWFQNASKIGFAVGEFAKLIRLASVTASKIGSVSRTSAGGSITEEIVKTVKGESEHQPLPEEPPFPDPVPEDIPPFPDPVSEDDPWDETEFD